ncbi:WYL domain-containing protein [Allofournierella massiliensis]|uniref:WYL domain-containing protein n=1 Tax=Allofournierella massiliensis TaxID=1650663 RepID=A0ABT7UTU6_9FIRM|nr:WYL domain-containing protein [Fournierella massiliensis]MDM8202306.1 WYL domain-containing protein [Fournierella massiliensis]
MYFDSTKEGYNQQLNDPANRVENKQRINVSRHAFLVLKQDAERFTGTSELTSGFLNRLLLNLYNVSNASIGRILDEKKQYLEEILAPLPESTSAKEHLIQVLLDKSKEEAVHQLKQLVVEKSNTIVFRVDKLNLEYLTSAEGQMEAAYYNNRIGQYFKALLEEYASYPYYQRESIYWNELLQKFEQAIQTHCQMKIRMNNKKQGLTLYVKPYCCRLDSEHLYNYLVVKSRTSPKEDWRIASLRFSSIADCSILKQSAILTQQERVEIKQKIEQFGVQYLYAVNNDEKVTVYLTEAGKTLYQQILHLRPEQYEKVDQNTYTFFCTHFQAETYFFQFGENAKILSPDSLAQKFAQRYARAAEQYK